MECKWPDINDATRNIGVPKRRGVSKFNLLEWSWGKTIMGSYTMQNNDKVNRLALYAPQWLRQTAARTDSGAKLGAYRTVSKDAAKGLSRQCSRSSMNGSSPTSNRSTVPLRTGAAT